MSTKSTMFLGSGTACEVHVYRDMIDDMFYVEVDIGETSHRIALSRDFKEVGE